MSTENRPLFSVGFRIMPEESELFSDIVADYVTHIDEVYFAWPGEPSGRSPVAEHCTTVLQGELKRISEMGVKLNLVLNASCYGHMALSRRLADDVATLMEEAQANYRLNTVTTMSPLIAHVIRDRYPRIDVRASVNMRLGTVKSMAYVADLFTSYNIQREYNRCIERLTELSAWAGENGKRLHVLANSGCMNFCSFQSFHDNVVAHEKDTDTTQQVSDLATLCRAYYADHRHRVNFLQGSWLRPEDISVHRRFFAGNYKLATRAHDDPRQVIHAYTTGRFYGNLLDLMEPGFSNMFSPFMIDNRRFPAEWAEKSMSCSMRCHKCDYCTGVYQLVCIDMNDVWKGGVVEILG